MQTVKSNYISRIGGRVELKFCIVFTIGEKPRVCSKYSHWYDLLLIWDVVSSFDRGRNILINEEPKLCGYV